MSVSLGIDIALSVIFLVVLFICFKRGIFKTLVTVVKIFVSLIATYYIQSLLVPLIAPYLSININSNVDAINTVASSHVFERYFHWI